MKKPFLISVIWTFGGCLALSSTQPAWPSESKSSARPAKVHAPSTADTVGLGALSYVPGDASAKDFGGGTYSLIVEGHNHFEQKETVFEIRQYGFGQSRIELGGGIGLRLAATSGVTLYGIDDTGGWIAPHLGYEPFSGQINWNTSDGQESFYQWFPMASAGLQFRAAGCRLLPLIKGGGAAGNFAKSGLGPRFGTSYGSSLHLNCGGFDLAAELVRLHQRVDADFAAIDLAIHPGGTGFRMGVRAEGILNRSAPSLSENRFMLILRTHPFS